MIKTQGVNKQLLDICIDKVINTNDLHTHIQYLPNDIIYLIEDEYEVNMCNKCHCKLNSKNHVHDDSLRVDLCSNEITTKNSCGVKCGSGHFCKRCYKHYQKWKINYNF